MATRSIDTWPDWAVLEYAEIGDRLDARLLDAKERYYEELRSIRQEADREFNDLFKRVDDEDDELVIDDA